MNLLRTILAVAVVAPLATFAQEITTTPVGFTEIECPSGATTVVSVPFLRQPTKHQGKVSTVASPSANRVQLTAEGDVAWTADEFANTHYVRVLTGTKAGNWYDIVNNGNNSVIIDTSGDDVATALAAGDTIMIVAHWTLDSLFPPADQTGADRVIHVSPSHQAADRRTEVEFPNLSQGVNLPAGPKFYLTSNGWHQDTAGTPAAGNTIIPPNTPFKIRHAQGLTATKFRPLGLVLMGKEVVPLATSNAGQQDNDIAITRPVPVKLSESGLESGFTASVGHMPFQIRDTLMVFDPAVNGGRLASAIYYRLGNNWYKNIGRRASNPIANDEVVFEAGTGVTIRKSRGDGSTVLWTNQPTY